MSNKIESQSITPSQHNIFKRYGYFWAMSVVGSLICTWGVYDFTNSYIPSAPDRDGYLFVVISMISVILTSAFFQRLINRKVSKPVSGALIGILNVILAYFFVGLILSTALFLGSGSKEIGSVLIILGAGIVAIFFTGLFFTGILAIPSGVIIGYFYVKKRGPLKKDISPNLDKV